MQCFTIIYDSFDHFTAKLMIILHFTAVDV